MANDLVSCGVKAYALVSDVSTLTAIGNDFGYENVFSRQLAVFGEKDDLLICLSGSGKSKNILNAIETAQDRGMKVLKVFGSEMNQGMQDAEEYQLKLAHDLMRSLRDNPL
jgi:phosphoheptose isomerase